MYTDKLGPMHGQLYVSIKYTSTNPILPLFLTSTTSLYLATTISINFSPLHAVENHL